MEIPVTEDLRQPTDKNNRRKYAPAPAARTEILLSNGMPLKCQFVISAIKNFVLSVVKINFINTYVMHNHIA